MKQIEHVIMFRQYQDSKYSNKSTLDNNNYYILSSLDHSSAFDIINRQLLFKRLEIFGLPEDVRSLIENWLEDRLFYVECSGNASTLHEDNSGTIQGSVLGPVLFCLFIRPILES